MENNKITMFRSLDAHLTNYTIKAKIISLWHKKMNGDDKQIYRVDMLLTDEEGSFIQCSCLNKLFKRFLKHLVVDDCLLIHKPSLAKDTTKIKVTGKDQKLSLYPFSSVLKIENWSGPRYYFRFTDFKSVLTKKVPANTPIDFVGYVVVSYPIEDVDKKDGTKAKRMNLTLKDLHDTKISLTLWENYAIEMSDYMNGINREDHVVLLVHFGTVNIYQEKIGLTNMFEASRLFINSDIDEIREFKDRYVEKEFSQSLTSKQSCSQVISNVEDQFLNAGDFEKKVVIVGTVIAISNHKPWYYLACNHCKKQIEERSQLVEKEDGSFHVLDQNIIECTNGDCEAVDITPIHRYKIPLRVQDSTGTVSCTLFDYEAIKLFKKTAKQLLDVYTKVDSSTEGAFQTLPTEFDTLINRKFAFQTKVSSYNIANQSENYGISMLSSDDDILSALEKKWKINEFDQSESNVQSLSDSVGNVKFISKESHSVIGDNVIPEHVDVTDHGQSKLENIKRNLQEVYDVDAVDSSSTKRPNIPGNVEIKDVIKFDLITPKLEK
ncbi:replication protein A 70 kDa DNA-binding subunit A-like [Helianthus annuus]|uniref:replication protein A 70 kDa DNA-binding subunit A-like n=1 Tax=Helianthus annuus TaxID=4232 RepID=UPI000B8F84AB|nr:replication protein A 70 kDa DNA-binding subunit A-like [Helianthus annuus]